MANVTAVYCLKAKKDRQNVELYRELAKFIRRQSEQGCVLEIQGLFEAKKGFRCEKFDMYQRGFKIDKSEYFLLVDGKDYDTNPWRLRRACRSKEEEHAAFNCQTGLPATSAVFDSGDPEERTDPELDENGYFRQLPVDFYDCEEETLPPELRGPDFVVTYDIREATPHDREDTWGIIRYDEKDFADDDPKVRELFRRLVRCDSAESIAAIADRQLVVDAILRRESTHFDDGEIYPHHSIVIAVIDGTNVLYRAVCDAFSVRFNPGGVNCIR